MSIITAARPPTRKGRAVPADTRPSFRLLASNECCFTPKVLQHQYLMAHYGLCPAFAVIAAPLVFGEAF